MSIWAPTHCCEFRWSLTNGYKSFSYILPQPEQPSRARPVESYALVQPFTHSQLTVIGPLIHIRPFASNHACLYAHYLHFWIHLQHTDPNGQHSKDWFEENSVLIFLTWIRTGITGGKGPLIPNAICSSFFITSVLVNWCFSWRLKLLGKYKNKLGIKMMLSMLC